MLYRQDIHGKLPVFRVNITIYSFNQLDLAEYKSKDQLKNKLLLAITEGKEGFGFA